MVKERINNMEKKLNVLKKAITRHKGGNKIEKVNKTDKPQASKSKIYKYIRNESKKVMALDKSSSLDKSRAYNSLTKTCSVKTQKQGLFHHPVYLIKVPK